MFASRILILAPHPDDEIVAFGAALGRAQRQDAKIFTLYLTNGCVAREVLWPWQRKRHAARVERRRSEALQAARLLDLEPLGFSDRPTRHLWRELPAVAEEIRRAIEAHDIEQLWVPAYEGGHADHDGLNGLCAALFKPNERMKEKEPDSRKLDAKKQIARFFRIEPDAPAPDIPPVLEFSAYNFAGGQKQSQAFPKANGTETILRLTREEKELKRKALALYASERGNLDYVETDREVFRPLAAYDYAKPPHPGKVWYARFHWVPFRHPRIDFTKPEEVCAAIGAFHRGA